MKNRLQNPKTGGKKNESSSGKTVQAKSFHPPDSGINFTIQKKENKTGLPDNLKSGIENLSGMDISDVKVHYNSAQPAQLNAHAYAQGNQIHVAPGQEKHLAHEAWHVVQQKQGRVKPTKQLKSAVQVNDDPRLEKEADVMGSKALQSKSRNTTDTIQQHRHKKTDGRGVKQFVVQLKEIQIQVKFLDQKVQMLNIDDSEVKTGAQLWEKCAELIISKIPPLRGKLTPDLFQAMLNGKVLYNDGKDVDLGSDTTVVFTAVGGNKSNMKEKEAAGAPFSSWSAGMKNSLNGALIILFNAPNGDKSKMGQQRIDEIKAALKGKGGIFTFIDAAFKNEGSEFLVHNVIAKESASSSGAAAAPTDDKDIKANAWTVTSSDGGRLLTAKNGNVIIHYISDNLSDPELDILKKEHGAKMYSEK